MRPQPAFRLCTAFVSEHKGPSQQTAASAAKFIEGWLQAVASLACAGLPPMVMSRSLSLPTVYRRVEMGGPSTAGPVSLWASPLRRGPADAVDTAESPKLALEPARKFVRVRCLFTTNELSWYQHNLRAWLSAPEHLNCLAAATAAPAPLVHRHGQP